MRCAQLERSLGLARACWSAAQSCVALGGTSSAEPPAPFLKMIVVHELAHLKQRANDKAFYGLWTHAEPTYHQLELELACG